MIVASPAGPPAAQRFQAGRAEPGSSRQAAASGTELPKIYGHCAPGFEALRGAFQRNFLYHGEVGAALSIVRAGELVVELWGGSSDGPRAHPWAQDSMVNLWSTSKGLLALCAHLLVERGVIDL